MRHKGYLLIALIAFCVALFFLPLSLTHGIRANSNEVVAPYEGLFADMVERFRQAGRLFWGPEKSLREREKVEEELARLRLQARRVQELERDNAQLRELLNFAKTAPHRLVLCDVITRNDISGWWQTIHLNRGDADGIAVNMAVITPDGLVGKIVDVSRHTASVLLITDPICKVAVKFPRSGGFGILRGGGISLTGNSALEVLCAPDPCRMDFIGKDAPLSRGDEVVTSGLGGVFPAGLTVGCVQKAYMDRSGLYQHADLAPAADMGALSRVFVVAE